MANLSGNLESDEFIDKLLIDYVKQRPSLHNTDVYSADDEREWDEIQTIFGMQSNVLMFCLIVLHILTIFPF